MGTPAGVKDFQSGAVLTDTDLNDHLMAQVIPVFANSAARGAAIASPSQGQFSYLSDSNKLEAYGGTATGWVHIASTGTAAYSYVTTIYYTSNDTFTKANYSWLRAMNVKVQGGGGAGGGCDVTSATQNSHGAGGGSGTYAEAFITDIAGLSDSIAITCGAGGTGGTAVAGGNGSASSFGTLIECPGGEGGATRTPSTSATTSAIGGGGGGVPTGSLTPDFVVSGSEGSSSFGVNPALVVGGTGANSPLGIASGGRARTSTSSITNFSNGYGAGGGGAMAVINNTVARAGRNGGDGIVIVELFA